MAAALAANDEPDAALETENTSRRAREKVFKRAMRNFDIAVLPQLEQRQLCLAARRFVNIPGAMWEGDLGECFPDEIKLEIPLVKEGIDKIKRDYNEHRIVPDFKPANGKGDDETAATLDGMHRADANKYKSQQAWDNAFYEAVDGGFGAWRLTNEWANPHDKDSDEQRINPGFVITDADQRVFFGPSDLYDKSDAPFAFLITPHARELYEEQYPKAQTDFDDGTINPAYDWYAPDVIKVAEYYEVEEVQEKLHILTHRLSQEEQRYWDSEIEDAELAEMKKMGWQVKTREMPKKRVHKYLLSGSEVLEDKGFIAGDFIPIVPVYGKRTFVDGIERVEGYTQSRMDVQRLYNMAVSKLAETSAMSPREIPIFAAQQMPPHIAEQWAKQVAERHAYAVVEPLIDPSTGQILAPGPIGKVEAPQIDQSTATVLQIARGDLMEGQQDGAGEVKANTSEEAMNVAATRVDARSGLYLDNMRQSTQRSGEVYLSMCADVNYEPDREVETMGEDGNDGTAKLIQPYVDQRGKAGYQNDFTRGNYKVIVSVTEATATRRDKTVKSCMSMADVAVNAQNPDLANVLLLTAVMNTDGEGLDDTQQWARKQLLQLGAVEPTDEEKAAMEQAAEQESQKPDPQQVLVDAQAKALEAGAAKDIKLAGKADADTELSKAKTAETLAKAHDTHTQTKLSPFAHLTKFFGGGQRQPEQRQ